MCHSIGTIHIASDLSRVLRLCSRTTAKVAQPPSPSTGKKAATRSPLQSCLASGPRRCTTPATSNPITCDECCSGNKPAFSSKVSAEWCGRSSSARSRAPSAHARTLSSTSLSRSVVGASRYRSIHPAAYGRDTSETNAPMMPREDEFLAAIVCASVGVPAGARPRRQRQRQWRHRSAAPTRLPPKRSRRRQPIRSATRHSHSRQGGLSRRRHRRATPVVQSVVQPLQRASEREICGWIDIWLIDRREENGESYPRIHTPESFTNVKGLRRLSGLALRRFFGPRARLAWLTPLLPLRRSCLSLPHRSFVRSTNTVAALFQYVSLAAGSRSPPPVVVVALARALLCESGGLAPVVVGFVSCRFSSLHALFLA